MQVVVELLGELLLEASFHGAARVVRSDLLRRLAGADLGLGFGWFWGDHLAGSGHWPRLLWVSIALGAAAFVLAVGRPRAQGPRFDWDQVLQPPWRWSSARLLDLGWINVGLAVGIALGYGLQVG